jgi:hypothetical protein
MKLMLLALGAALCLLPQTVHAQVELSQGASTVYMNSSGAGTGANLTVHVGGTVPKWKNKFGQVATIRFRRVNGVVTDTVLHTTEVSANSSQDQPLGPGGLAIREYSVWIQLGSGTEVNCGTLNVEA